jgi:omega-6 fatty acid desaturase (delta-12 desaturase)
MSSQSINSRLKTGNVPKIDSMADVINAMGVEALKIDLPFAIFTFFRVWVTVVVTTYLTTIAPWYLLPFAWILQGTAATGLFVVGHDCAHQSFSHSRVLNEVIGTICMSPLLFPYGAWEHTHNHHHTHANNLDKDFLWKPLTEAELKKMSPLKRNFLYYFYGPLFFQSSLIHHAFHFLIPFTVKKMDVKIKAFRSIIFCVACFYWLYYYGAAAFGAPLLISYVPAFLVFQFWLSTFTYFHHRHKDAAGWKQEANWDKVYGGLYATVHVDFPAWIEFLTLDINWHLPHHASSLVPWYNLRPATYNLLKRYGDVLQTDVFTWKLWRETTTQCHMFSDDGFKQFPNKFD